MRVCKHCNWEVDDEVCWCGTEESKHASAYIEGHMFIPMGCTCGFNDAERRRNTWKNRILNFFEHWTARLKTCINRTL